MYSDQARLKKAKKIEAVLTDYLGRPVRQFRILDLGAGSGLIGQYLAKHNTVFFADQQDYRQFGSPIEFIPVEHGVINCPDDNFDIVLTNMVIEHTDSHAQHLDEVKRVLKKGGIAYLSAPNKYFPFEPHYKMLFIHYLPLAIQMRVLVFISRFKKLSAPLEEVRLPGYFHLKRLLQQRFECNEYTARLLKEPEKFFLETKFFQSWPQWLLRNLVVISPSNVFIIKKK